MARTYMLQAPAPASRLGIAYERELNDEQRDVVFAPDGPSLVIAGAGSGKTRALTYRVAQLIDRGVNPARILLITFTNRAAREMVERVVQLCGAAGRQVTGGTFHHVANLLLRDHAQSVGHEPNFTIVDREDARELLQAAIAQAGVEVRARRFPKADVVMDLVSRSLNEQLLLADILARQTPHFIPLTQEILTVARAYVHLKVRHNVMDFDDLLMNWKVLLTESPQVAQAVVARFDHVLVDEYQDTNQLQGDVVDLMASVHRNVMVVGDDAQCIYGFRGARFDNIHKFPERFPGAALYKLEVNYRSTPQILSLCNASLRHNAQRYDKTLRAVRPQGPLPALVPARDVFDQARFVAQRVLELRDQGIGLNDMGVLYRAHSHALELQVELTRRGIPYTVRSGLRFFEQAHIKDVLAYLRFVHNPREDLGLRRAVKLHDGVGNAAAEHVSVQVAAGLQQGREVRSAEFLASIPLPSFPRARAGLQSFGQLVGELMRKSVLQSPQEAIRLILDGGYRDYLRKNFPNARDREMDLEQLSDYCAAFSSVEEMVQEVSLLEGIQGETVLAVDSPDERLTLSSVHQAKGLEWRAVFVLWLTEGHMPSDMALKDLNGEEEERRVFYVACTRAKDELYLCYPTSHLGKADRRLTMLRPSRFLTELGDVNLPEGEALPWERWQLLAENAPVTVMTSGPVVETLTAGEG